MRSQPDVLTETTLPNSHAAADSWQAEMRSAVRDLATLARLLDLDPDDLARGRQAGREFPLFVPRSYVARMHRGDREDPLLLQVLPHSAETDSVPGFTADPLAERDAHAQPGILQKYQGRALLVVNGTCAVHCRYCFRRHFPYQELPDSPSAWNRGIEAIRHDSSIREVILSGGDPLTLTDSRFSQLVDSLAVIPQLERIRIHTRLPIVIPQRITAPLLDVLAACRLTAIMVVHANHAREIDRAVADAVGRVIDRGIPVLNQAVLLRGVNDTVDAQFQLSEALINQRVLPYYLHQLDRVSGAAHFETPAEVGPRIIAALRSRLPGYAVPRFVTESAGQPSKTVLA